MGFALCGGADIAWQPGPAGPHKERKKQKMNKEKEPVTYNTKLRRAAGYIYMALAIIQLACLYRSVFAPITLGSFNYVLSLTVAGVAQLLLLCAVTGLSIWLLAGEEAISKMAKRVIAFSTAYWIILEVLTYGAQARVLVEGISPYIPAVSQSYIIQFFIVFTRLALLVFAAFLAAEEESEEDRQEALKEARRSKKGRKNKAAKNRKAQLDKAKAKKKDDDEEEEQEDDEEEDVKKKKPLFGFGRKAKTEEKEDEKAKDDKKEKDKKTTAKSDKKEEKSKEEEPVKEKVPSRRAKKAKPADEETPAEEDED